MAAEVPTVDGAEGGGCAVDGVVGCTAGGVDAPRSAFDAAGSAVDAPGSAVDEAVKPR